MSLTFFDCREKNVFSTIVEMEELNKWSFFFFFFFFSIPPGKIQKGFSYFAFVSVVDFSSALVFEFYSSRVNIYPKNVGM